jgi:hypothetical protein
MDIFEYMNNPVKAADFARLHMTSPAFRNATKKLIRQRYGTRSPGMSVQVDDSGKPYLAIKKGFETFKARNVQQANTINNYSFSSVRKITGKQAKSSMFQPSIGGYSSDPLEFIADKLGGTIEVKSYQLKDPNTFRAMFAESGYDYEGKAVGHGFPIVQNDVGHILSFTPRGATEAVSVTEFHRLMSEALELGIDTSKAQLAKRLNTLVSGRALAVAGMLDEVGFDIGTFTAEQFMNSIGSMPGSKQYGANLRAEIRRNPDAYIDQNRLREDAIKIAEANGTDPEDELKKLLSSKKSKALRAMEDVAESNLDGHLIISGEGLDTFITEKEARVAQLRKIHATKRLNGETSELRSLDQEIKAQEGLIDQLKTLKNKGGSANFRNIQDGMFKGDVIILPKDQYEGVARSTLGIPKGPFPKILAYEGIASNPQMKNELRMGLGSITTLELRNKAMPLQASLSQITAFPEIFTPEYLQRSFQAEADEVIDMISSPISKTGALSQMVDKILEDSSLLDTMSQVEFDEYMQTKEFAKRIRTMLDYGVNPDEVDVMGRQFISMYNKHFSKLRSGKEVMNLGTFSRLPNYDYRRKVIGGFRAEISPEGTTAPFRRGAGTLDFARNRISYDETTGRVSFNTLDTRGILSTLGGADFDDSVGVVVKYDREARKAVAFVYRDPTEAGEFLLMDADLTTVPLMNVKRDVADNVKYLSRKKKQIMKELNSKDSTFMKALHNEMHASNLTPRALRNAQSKIRRLEELRSELNSVQRELDRVLSANLDSISIRGSFGPGSSVNAPKGYGFDQAGLDAQYARSIVNSNQDTSALQHLEFLRSFKGEVDGSLNPSGIYRFKGTSENLADSRFFTSLNDEAMRAYSRANQQGQTLSKRVLEKAKLISESGQIQDAAFYRATVLSESNMVLEQWANVKTGLDQIYTETLRSNYDKFQGLGLESVNVIQRETIIDAAVKNADMELLDAAETITQDAAKAMTRNLIKIHKAGLGDGIGFDKYIYDTKMASVHQAILSELEGSDITLDQILLNKGRIHGIIQEGIESSQKLSEVLSEKVAQNSIGLTALDDFAPTADEITIAQEYIDNYIAASKEISQRTPESIMSGLLDGSLDPATYLDDGEEINRRNLQFLMDRGLLEDGAQKARDRQVLAIAKVSEMKRAELNGSMRHGIFSSLLTDSSDARINVSMSDMLFSAVNKHRYKSKIEEYNFNLQAIKDSSNTEAVDAAKARATELYTELRDYFPNLRGELDSTGVLALPEATEEVLSSSGRISKDGSTLLGLRNTADEASEAVSKAAHVMQRFSMDGFKQMVRETKGAKGVLMGLGFMVALGALHGDKKLDRTPEDMSGPPLLPGGSAYEDYSETDDFSSIYSMASGNSMSPGMLYQVNVNGRIEPTELQNRIQSITGGSMNSTIYKGRETVRTGYQDSQSIMSDRFGF